MFIDGAGTSTKMARRYGRAPRGERCRAAVPHGHWKTTTVTAGLIALVYGIVRSAEAGWGSGEVLGILSLAAVLLVAFVLIEQRSAEPLVRLSIFSVKTVRGANVAMLIVAGGLFARHRPALAALTVAIAALSVLLALQIGGSDTGWWQRAWLLVNTGWLVALVLTTTRPSRSTPPVPPG